MKAFASPICTLLGWSLQNGLSQSTEKLFGGNEVILHIRYSASTSLKAGWGDSQWEDIHVITGALKLFFRELPEPLFPFCFFEQFVEAISEYTMT